MAEKNEESAVEEHGVHSQSNQDTWNQSAESLWDIKPNIGSEASEHNKEIAQDGMSSTGKDVFPPAQDCTNGAVGSETLPCFDDSKKMVSNPANATAATGPSASMFLHDDYSSMMKLTPLVSLGTKMAVNVCPVLAPSESHLNQLMSSSPVGKESGLKIKREKSCSIDFSPYLDCDPFIKDPEKRKRFYQTRAALENMGLMDITTKTAGLIRSNKILEQEIRILKHETSQLLKSCVENAKKASDSSK